MTRVFRLAYPCISGYSTRDKESASNVDNRLSKLTLHKPQKYTSRYNNKVENRLINDECSTYGTVYHIFGDRSQNHS